MATKKPKPIKVKGKWVNVPTTPQWYASGGYGPRQKWQPAHYALPGGRWVSKPGTTKKPTVGSGVTTTPPPPPPDDTGYGSDAWMKELERRAHALAASQLASKAAAIERARQAANAQAQRDAATYGALGQAQMGMIGQIPANIQAIRNTAGQAIASYGNQLAGGQAATLGAEQAAGAAFTAAQTGMAPNGPGPAAPAVAAAASDGAAPAATGPGPAAGTPGLNTQAAMAASAQLGGVLPAREQAEIGAASSIAASGMPAVVARATQDQVAMRMAQAATEDADYRQQLIDLASEEGGAYETALSSLYDIEKAKYGAKEANERLKLDQAEFEEKKKQQAWENQFNLSELALKKRAQLASEVLAKVKTKQQADKEYHDWLIAQDKSKQSWTTIQQGATKVQQGERRLDLEQQRVDLQKQGLTLKNQSQANALAIARQKGRQIDAAGSKVAGHLVDKSGRAIKDNKGHFIGLAPGSKSGGSGGKGVKAASDMAKDFRGTPYKTGKNSKGQTVQTTLPPKVQYGSALGQIIDRLTGMGYPHKEAEAIARNALNARYAPGWGGRPKKPKKKKG